MPAPDVSPIRSLATLRRFAQRPVAVELCEICGRPLAASHAHLLEPATRRITCACDCCAIVSGSAAGGRFRRIPSRAVYLPDFRLTDAQWESLLIPINVAFFFYSTAQERTIALYPSPAGATESLLDLSGWNEIVTENPMLAALEHDVEALLVNRLPNRQSPEPRSEHFIAPIDECFKLVGIIRSRWHGLSGGTEVWQEIERFFTALKDKSDVKPSVPECIGS
jgi:hypothetical protein